MLVESIIHKLLQGDHPILNALRVQFAESSVTKQTASSAGQYTDFSTPSKLAIGNGAGVRFQIDGVQIESPLLKYGAGAILFIENGLISVLEIFTYNEDWPTNLDSFTLNFTDDRRDLLTSLDKWLVGQGTDNMKAN